MLSFLASPKPFVGRTGVIQRNAIRSWKAVHPDAEILIYGSGEGIAEVCHEMGLGYIPDIPCSPSGVPYFNGIAAHATQNGRYDTQCYINSDIILAGKIVNAIHTIPFDRFLVTGQRIDLRDSAEIDCSSNHWPQKLLELISEDKAVLHPPTGMDYFVFKRGTWESLLPCVIGRVGYDEALVLYCLRNKIPFINATLAILALHQFHDYHHLKDGVKSVALCEDAQNNYKVHRNFRSRPNSADAPWLLLNGEVRSNDLQIGVLRKLEHFVRFSLGMERTSLLFRILWRIGVKIGIVRPRQISIQDITGIVITRQGV